MSPALDLGVLNDHNDDVVVEADVEEALKSSIFSCEASLYKLKNDKLSGPPLAIFTYFSHFQAYDQKLLLQNVSHRLVFL